MESQSNFNLQVSLVKFLNYQVIWGSHWQDGVLLPLLKKWSRLTLICHDVETLLSTCFLKVSVLPPMVYYLRIQPFPDREQFKNELCCFRLLHKFLTWHNLSNVLKFTLHVIIFFIIII